MQAIQSVYADKQGNLWAISVDCIYKLSFFPQRAIISLPTVNGGMTTVYSLTGHAGNRLGKGINLVRTQNGNTRKIIH